MAVLKSLKKGDRIRATVVVKKDDEHLENVQVMSGTQSTATK
jgi:hypothetical protein